MTKKEIDGLADAISSLATGRKFAPTPVIFFDRVVDALMLELRRYGAFDEAEFVRRCYS